MLLKISLGLAIIVGLATLYISHFQVAPKIQTLTAERNQFEQEKQAAQEAEANAKKEADTAKTNLEKGLRDLADATNTLQKVFARAAEQEKRASRLTEELTKTTEERNEAQRELAAWRAMGVPIDQVRAQRDALKTVNQERDGLVEENKIILRNNNQIRAELDKYVGGGEREVKLPLDLKGKVVAVDPKWDFVVLDIGANQNVLQNGKMLVNRDGKLVAKIKIMSVEPDRSIANVLPEWKQDEIMEGDQVLSSK
ncbi:MAG: hypothetical protein AAB466_03550 [Verrucomicrobiota bacterium]